MIGNISHSFSASASYAGGKVVDRLYPGSPSQVKYKSRFQSFREVFHDAISTQFPEMLSKAGFQENESLEDKINLPATGYIITVPQEHLKKLQPTQVETRQEKLFSSFNPSAKDLTGSLVNMSV
ncbi:MAG TPA: hypothetical protein VHO43_08850 [Ignavibacteriales bacterium]|nr:hypothetical protein [Ignavibacteriales bacterium]